MSRMIASIYTSSQLARTRTPRRCDTVDASMLPAVDGVDVDVACDVSGMLTGDGVVMVRTMLPTP